MRRTPPLTMSKECSAKSAARDQPEGDDRHAPADSRVSVRPGPRRQSVVGNGEVPAVWVHRAVAGRATAGRDSAVPCRTLMRVDGGGWQPVRGAPRTIVKEGVSGYVRACVLRVCVCVYMCGGVYRPSRSSCRSGVTRKPVMVLLPIWASLVLYSTGRRGCHCSHVGEVLTWASRRRWN